MKKRMLDICLLIMGLVIVIIVVLIAIKYGNNMVNEKKMTNIVEYIKNADLQLPDANSIEEDNTVTEIEIDGYKVLGIIRIPKIDLEYPILN